MSWLEFFKNEIERACRYNPVLSVAALILALLAVVFLTPLIAEFALALILILAVGAAIYWLVEKCGFIK